VTEGEGEKEEAEAAKERTLLVLSGIALKWPWHFVPFLDIHVFVGSRTAPFRRCIYRLFTSLLNDQFRFSLFLKELPKFSPTRCW